MTVTGASRESDFGLWVIEEVERARATAAAAEDRVNALLELAVVTSELEHRLKRPLVITDVFFAGARDEVQRARLQALARRIAPDIEEES